MEFDASQLYANSYGASSSSLSFVNLRQGESAIFILALAFLISQLNNAFPVRSTLTEGYTYLFFLAAINIFTGFFVMLWFTDFFFIQEELNSNGVRESFNHIFVPQIEFSFAVDEIRITLILGFFLIGGGESEDDSDFLLNDQADLDIVEDVVAPLFVANLGKDFTENGALYIKVCAIFSFVLISNLLGRIPYGDTATSSLILTF